MAIIRSILDHARTQVRYMVEDLSISTLNNWAQIVEPKEPTVQRLSKVA